MTTTPRCPLTHDTNVRLLQSIRSSDVIQLYRRLNLDASKEFEGIKEFGFYHALTSDVKFFYPAVCGSPTFYEQLQLRGDYYEKNKFEFEVVAPLIRPSMRVLEIGYGDGAFAKTLRSEHVYYLGIESNPNAVAAAQAAGINVKTASSNEFFMSQESSFDMVCAFQVLEHIDDVSGTLEKMLAALSSGGYLILSVPNDDGFIGKTINHLFNLPPHHVTRWSQKAIRHIADRCNLQVHRIVFEPLPKIHWKWYVQASFFDEMKHRLFPNYRHILDTRLSMRLIMKLSDLLATTQTRRFMPESAYGHTLVAVFQKK